VNLEKDFPGAAAFPRWLQARENERALVLTDDCVEGRAVELIAESFRARGVRVTVDFLPVALGSDIPQAVYTKLALYDIIIFAASQSWYQAPSRRRAKYELRKRVVECYAPTIDMMRSGALCADPDRIQEAAHRLALSLMPCGTVRICTAAGTDLKADIAGVFEETGKYDAPATGGNLPAGEISCGLRSGSAEGTIVFDMSFDRIGRLENKPLVMQVENGMVVSAEGPYGQEAQDMLWKQNTLRSLAEIGLGINASAMKGRSVLEDEKVQGTAHVGFGNDTYFGGTTGGPHLDGVMDGAEVYADGRKI
jgi:leucyl aminopeptidase (aminopeptidase T)